MRKVPGAKNAKELLPSVLLNERNDAGVNPIIIDAPTGVNLAEGVRYAQARSYPRQSPSTGSIATRPTVNSAFPTPKNYADKKGDKAGWVKLWDGMALPPSVPAAQNPSAGQATSLAGEAAATPSGQSLESTIPQTDNKNPPSIL